MRKRHIVVVTPVHWDEDVAEAVAEADRHQLIANNSCKMERIVKRQEWCWTADHSSTRKEFTM